MLWHDKVVWQEGMFLRAQHFQQQDRHAEWMLQARVAPLRAHPWGITELSLDRGSPHWAQMQNSGAFAIHVSGEFPSLKMELWAIRG